jgi:hypothetical protein
MFFENHMCNNIIYVNCDYFMFFFIYFYEEAMVIQCLVLKGHVSS